MKQRFQFSLIKNQILIGTILILLFAVGATGLLAFVQIRIQEKDRAQERLAAIEVEVKRFLDREADTLQAEGNMIGVVPIIRAVIDSGDKETIADTLLSYREELHFESVEAFDLSGKSVGNAGTGSLALSQYAKNIFTTNPDDLHKLHGTFLSEKGPLIVSASPVGVNDHNSGFLVVTKKIDSQTVDTLSALTGAHLEFLADGAQEIPPRPELLNDTNLERTGELQALPPGKVLKCRFHMESDSAAEKFKQFKLLLLMVAGIIAVLASLFAAYFAHKVSGPLIKLNQFTKDIILRKGVISKTRLKKDREDEIGELTESVNHFLDEIESRQLLLEQQNTELENTVLNRTRELTEANADLSSLLNNLEEGFFAVDSSGIVCPGSTKVTHEIFGAAPTGKLLSTLFATTKEEQELIAKWVRHCFSAGNTAGFEVDDLLAFSPKSFTSKNNRNFSIEFRSIKAPDGSLHRLICILKDVTDEIQYRQQLEKQENRLKMVTGIIETPGFFVKIYADLKRLADGFESPDFDLASRQLRQDMHSIKGLAASVHLSAARDLAAKWEDSARNEPRAAPALIAEEFRADLQKLKKALDDFQRELSRFGGEAGRLSASPNEKQESFQAFYEKISRNLGKDSELTVAFREYFLEADLKSLFAGMNEVVAYNALKTGKEVSFSIAGDRIGVNKDFYAPLSEVLVHMIRNSLDHGIETPAKREHLGKLRAGKVAIDCRTAGSKIQIKFSDDGSGIDVTLVKKKALEKNRISAEQAAALSDQEALRLIFLPDLSTKASVTELSGMGIGMEFVKNAVEKLGGQVDVSSQKEAGTDFLIELPWIRA